MNHIAKTLLGFSALAMVSCADWYTTHQLPAPDEAITVQETFTYTLAPKDYDSIATHPTIIALAHEIDNTDTTLVASDSTTYKALVRLADTHCFENDTYAGYFLPTFLKHNFRGASIADNEGSTFKVTYRVENSRPAYLDDFAALQEYTLVADDYTLLGSKSAFLTDTDLSADNLQWLMLEHFDDAAALDMFVLTFDYLRVGNERKLIVQLSEEGYWQIYTIEATSIYVVPNSFYDQINASYATKPATQLPIFLLSALPYAEADATYCVVYKNATGWTAGRFTFDGTAWTMWVPNKLKTTNFILTDNQWVISPYYLSESFANNSQGDFTIQNTVLPAALTYVWTTSSSYGMKASAYANSTKYTTESWLISPSVSLLDAESPVLIFDQASKYFSDFTAELSVWGSTDFAGDVTTCTWTQIPFLQDGDGNYLVPDGTSWDFMSSGELNLSAFKGKTFTVAFKYTSNESAAATWEIKNLYIKEK